MRAGLAVIAWLLCAVAVRAQPPTPALDTAAAAPETRQLLLMLHAPPPHYRPDAGYGGDYRSAPGRPARRRIAAGLARAHGLQLREDWPMPALGLDCFVLEAADAPARTAALARLAADPRVESVQPMQRFEVLDGGAPRKGALQGDVRQSSAHHSAAPAGDPLAAAQPAVARWRLRELHALSTGRGVTVAALDTGVDLRHPDLRGRVAQARNFVDAGAAPAEAHGTAVAAIIAARAGDGVGIAGIAPQARLLALRACWPLRADAGAAACSSFTLAKALQFALDADADVINLSLTGPHDRLLARLLDTALARGVSVVAAVDAGVDGGGFPAAHPGVLAVAGERDRVPRPGVLHAPDLGVPTAAPGGGWGLVSGPSYAAAQVSGLVALLRALSPRLHGAPLHAALAPGLGLAPRRPTSIDACAAVSRAAGRCACGCGAAATGSAGKGPGGTPHGGSRPRH